MRTIVSFNEGWLFTKQGKDEPVTLPHTWNAVDGQDGGDDYYRGLPLHQAVPQACAESRRGSLAGIQGRSLYGGHLGQRGSPLPPRGRLQHLPDQASGIKGRKHR